MAFESAPLLMDVSLVWGRLADGTLARPVTGYADGRFVPGLQRHWPGTGPVNWLPELYAKGEQAVAAARQHYLALALGDHQPELHEHDCQVLRRCTHTAPPDDLAATGDLTVSDELRSYIGRDGDRVFTALELVRPGDTSVFGALPDGGHATVEEAELCLAYRVSHAILRQPAAPLLLANLRDLQMVRFSLPAEGDAWFAEQCRIDPKTGLARWMTVPLHSRYAFAGWQGVLAAQHLVRAGGFEAYHYTVDQLLQCTANLTVRLIDLSDLATGADAARIAMYAAKRVAREMVAPPEQSLPELFALGADAPSRILNHSQQVEVQRVVGAAARNRYPLTGELVSLKNDGAAAGAYGELMATVLLQMPAVLNNIGELSTQAAAGVIDALQAQACDRGRLPISIGPFDAGADIAQAILWIQEMAKPDDPFDVSAGALAQLRVGQRVFVGDAGASAPWNDSFQWAEVVSCEAQGLILREHGLYVSDLLITDRDGYLDERRRRIIGHDLTPAWASASEAFARFRLEAEYRRPALRLEPGDRVFYRILSGKGWGEVVASEPGYYEVQPLLTPGQPIRFTLRGAAFQGSGFIVGVDFQLFDQARILEDFPRAFAEREMLSLTALRQDAPDYFPHQARHPVKVGSARG